MQSKSNDKIKFQLLGIVGLILAVPCFAFSQYLNQVNETLFDYETTLAYNFEGDYLTSVNTMSDSNWVQNGWNIIQFKQYDDEFNVINETRFQDSAYVYLQGSTVIFFNNEYYFSGWRRELYLAGDAQGFVAKFDESGELIWLSTYFPLIEESKVELLKIINGRIYIAGSHRDISNSLQHPFISELNSDGDILWTETFDSFDNATISKLEGISDGILLSGRYFAQGTNQRVVLYKLDFDGNTQWQKTYGITGSWLGNNFAPLELPNGQLLLYGGQSHPQTEKSGSWLLFTDAQGNILQDTVYHFSQRDDYFNLLYSPPIIRENDFLVLGYIRESTTSPHKAYLACIDFDFNIKWKRTFGERESENRLTFIHDLENDFYLLSGFVFYDDNHPTTDEWFVVVDSMGCDVTNCYLGLEEDNKEAVGFSVYPNPTSGKTTFSIDFTPTNNSSIVITDLQGRKVKTLAITQKETQIDLDLVVDGIYLVHLVENGQVQATKKLIYEK